MSFFEQIPNELYIIAMSMMPVVELRGAIPLGVSLGFSTLHSTILAIIGNSVIVPVLLLIIEPLFAHMKRLEQLRGFVERLEVRAASKVQNYRKYRLLGLFILVAIPVPTTGVYTGCIAAVILRIRPRNASMAIIAGVVAAGIIVFMVTEHILF
ncbi:MAG: ligand-binding protein SH3 [Acidaminobacter sp.]|uniref:COG2426 family protein n=1 Tax=Acidaminobacter sp. TaxID=1872102 RepID=UPI001382EC28|nr:small multi-drug export protein [Acidaminobacter sp.]MZQ98259.1 ligand-binding protein SH3 [Acidaminobacter sp.]